MFSNICNNAKQKDGITLTVYIIMKINNSVYRANMYININLNEHFSMHAEEDFLLATCQPWR